MLKISELLRRQKVNQMSIKYLKVENEKSLVRDATSRAILNTDLSAVKKHQLKMKELERTRNREEEINSLKKDIDELRQLLLTLVDKK